MKRRFGSSRTCSRRSGGHGVPGVELTIRAGPADNPGWSGTAAMLLVGNGRRFPGEAGRRANVEDGRLNVVVVEWTPAVDHLARGAADRLLGRGNPPCGGWRCRR